MSKFPGKFFIRLNQGLRILFNHGPLIFIRKASGFIRSRISHFPHQVDFNQVYPEWIERNKLTLEDLEQKRSQTKSFKYKPRISIIFPVYNVDEKWLRLAIDSVLEQIYQEWELCIVDDASTKPHVKPLLGEFAAKDTRIKLKFSEKNQNISLCSNECIRIATGEFIFLMDNDDELEPNTLFEFVRVINENNNQVDLIYPDEDQLEVDGDRISPIFKPDWSPETMLSMMYVTRGCFRKTIIDEIGGFRAGYEGSQDYDLVLRFSEKTTPDRIFHVPQILYHWRRIPGSTAESYDAKPYAKLASIKLLKDTIERRGINGTLVEGLTLPSFHIKREIRNNPKVSIIIPTKDKVNLLKQCISSIESKTKSEGFSYEIVVINHESKDSETIKYFDSIRNKHKVVDYSGPFNYSTINNFAVKNCDGDYLLFLNNDTKVINDEWLYEMLQIAQEDNIGAVGAKLLFPNQTIQHAGLMLNEDDVAVHIFRGFWRAGLGYMDRIQITSNVSAVTAACMLVTREAFESVGGFNETDLAVAYNDVDLCLKLMDKGYRNIYTPFAELYHYESMSRGSEDSPEKLERFQKEKDYMKRTWQKYIKQDKYFNPNLVMENGVLKLRF